jgi:RimJ/RimL family protein N-acetyltransferase
MAAGPLDLPALSDGVVYMRAFAEEDAPALAAIWRDPAIRARNDVPEPSEEAARAWVARSAARAAAGEAWEWAIVDAASGELAGRRALKQIDWAQRRAVAATWVSPRFRGRHFAARSLRLAAVHAFANGLVRIHAECETDNEASFRSLLAAGMRHEGTLRAHFVPAVGAPVDMHVFGMLPGDLAGAPALRTGH